MKNLLSNIVLVIVNALNAARKDYKLSAETVKEIEKTCKASADNERVFFVEYTDGGYGLLIREQMQDEGWNDSSKEQRKRDSDLDDMRALQNAFAVKAYLVKDRKTIEKEIKNVSVKGSNKTVTIRTEKPSIKKAAVKAESKKVEKTASKKSVKASKKNGKSKPTVKK